MNRIITIGLLITAFFFITPLQAQVKKKTTTKRTVVKTKKAAPKPAVVAAPAIKEQFTRVKISTDMGDIVVKLYNKTPKHRDNFIKLVNDHFYDSLLFHRVIKDFMIQGGDPNSKHAAPGEFLGAGDVGYTVPAEFDSALYHKKGALCAARTNNPEKASSGCQFYIVQGRKSSDGELDNIQTANRLHYTSAQRMTYKMNGGTPFLDMNYTVFGEVESGMDVIDKIAAAPGNSSNRPNTDIRMRMEVLQ
ncbi:MAG: peptidylprolyl isomerase [Chitinophagaceae bacterium]|nr:peptidylprolyl isomerase [Chitinophagaceae bacterium]